MRTWITTALNTGKWRPSRVPSIVKVKWFAVRDVGCLFGSVSKTKADWGCDSELTGSGYHRTLLEVGTPPDRTRLDLSQTQRPETITKGPRPTDVASLGLNVPPKLPNVRKRMPWRLFNKIKLISLITIPDKRVTGYWRKNLKIWWIVFLDKPKDQE